MEGPVAIRIFTPQSGVDEKIAERLQHELEELKTLPEDYFVRHLELRRSSDGLWYRVSEWLDAENWGDLLASGRFQDLRVAVSFFYRLASILDGLHRIGHIIPHLILDDIIAFTGDEETLKVKIDYKLSRFLDPKLDRPGPMLKKLLSCHPDIIHQRPLDFRSDIWSLGKIFVELLAADPETIDFHAKIDVLTLPKDMKVLLKIMLADDPALRPSSMAEVAETLLRIKNAEIESAGRDRLKSAPTAVREIRGLKVRLSLLVAVLTILGILGVLAWIYFASHESEEQDDLGDYANRYAESVAFVMVDYFLRQDETIVYRNRSEGTAFLVDTEGYLLTNRHVACPWLEDHRLVVLINRLRPFQRPLQLEYGAYLWFEGTKAFKRLPGLSDSPDLADIYDLEAAYSSTGSPRLTIAGVARAPIKTWQKVKSPLEEDFAVLKIDRVPEGLLPLPLDHQMEALKIPRLSAVITLGFPLGSRTQEATVNVSVTRGHVRRSFENLIQVDTSIHRGNSGGPIIDSRGKVIGIASRVAMEWATGPVPVATLLPDIGMVLPINRAVNFLRDLKAGQAKWNGVLDLSIDIKLKKIMDLADQEQWAEAAALADRELASSADPNLLMAAGMMHFCAGDDKGAGSHFDRALSMDAENDRARFMLFLIDWLSGQSATSTYRPKLLALDWRSPFEFFGYLVRVLEGIIDEKSVPKGGYSKDERSWLHYVLGLILAKRGEPAKSEIHMRQAVLEADNDKWLFFLTLSRLEQMQRQRLSSLENAARKDQYQAEIKLFAMAVKESLAAKTERQNQIAPLLARLKQNDIGPEDKRAVLEKILEKEKTNGELLVGLVFFSAMTESWDRALDYARKFLEFKGRENAGRLSVGLFAIQILHHTGHQEEAKARLEGYIQHTTDVWYRSIGECLLTKRTEQSLTDQAGESPEHLVTAHTALGFWAEGSGNTEKAIKHYKEALGSYMDDRLEYEFARERIKRLRQG
jgi:S1-C subfamily serine protease